MFIDDNILSSIIDNQGGALKRNSDGEWVLDDLPTEGYYVGVHNIAVVDAVDCAVFTAHKALRDALAASYFPAGYNYPDQYFLGFWRDMSTGTWYIDISEHFTDLDAAKAVAAENGELAVWDIALDQGIWVVPVI